MSPFVNCRCGRLVAIRMPDGGIEVRHKGRRIRAWRALITCEGCGETTCVEALDRKDAVVVV